MLAIVLAWSPFAAVGQSVTNYFTTAINLTTTNIDDVAPTITEFALGPGGINTNYVAGGWLDGDSVFFRRPIDDWDGSGSGIFRTMYQLTDNLSGVTNNPLNGYNRVTTNFPDVAMPGGLVKNQTIMYSNLLTDSSGQYFIFNFDANEVMAGDENPYLSMDDLRFYRGTTNDPNPLPGLNNLGDLGTLVWEMNPAGETNFVWVDASLNEGSGTSDMFVFVKKSLFEGAQATDFIYLYSSFGQYQYIVPGATDMNFTDGFEEWALLGSGTFELVPEPGTIAFLLVSGVGLIWHTRRRRASRRS